MKKDFPWIGAADVSAMMADVRRAAIKRYNYVDILPDWLITSGKNLGIPTVFPYTLT